ncbi:MAG TPA: 8-amino-7-oxononanoate synthase [Rhizomicrobium sp.]|nr:8-amino-7-oxononanoate synthase [Rhizomicrobium sp.]
MTSLDEFASSKLRQLDDARLKRSPVETVPEDDVWVSRGGKRLICFSSNDYLNLAGHPAVKAAAIAAIHRYGAGARASRLVTGNHPLLTELERRLARLKGTEAACVFGSGYLANSGIIPTLIGRDDLILIDELAHSCLWSGATLSRAQIAKFRHNDTEHAAELLASRRADFRRALIVTDGVFSMDGDIAPLSALSDLARSCDSWLMVDDAHGVGVLGQGRGSSFAQAGKAHIELQMGTLSKALGSSGGYLCASRPVIDLMKTRARTFIYSTGLSPADAAAAIAAVDIVMAQPELVAKPLRNARLFCSLMNLPPAQSAVVPLILGAPEAALKASEQLERNGFLVTAIRPPTVPAGTARLRLAFTAAHRDDQIERLAQACRSFAISPEVPASSLLSGSGV